MQEKNASILGSREEKWKILLLFQEGERPWEERAPKNKCICCVLESPFILMKQVN